MTDPRMRCRQLAWLRSRIRRALKHALRRRDGSACCFCRRRLSFREATFEHVVPHSQGGRATFHNLKLSCSPCNHARGVRPFGEFLAECRRNERLRDSTPPLTPKRESPAP
jgi:5-methylcytosine-specific restriction endonuclease McrA